MLDAVMNVLPTTSFCKYDHLPTGCGFSSHRDEDMIVWKQTHTPRYYRSKVVVKLKIPKDAAIVFTPSKCRASRAIVLGFYPCEYGGEEMSKLDIPYAMSWYDQRFTYCVGEEVVPDFFDPDPMITCSHGIHFFMTFEEAACYIP